MPRVVLVPGVGLFGIGNTAKDAKIAADLAETTVAVIADAERLGTFESIPEPDIFDIEYWSLEQAKLSSAAEKPLARRIVVVTGGASGIGAATAAAFAREGAEVAVLDRDVSKAKGFGGRLRRDRSHVGARRVRQGRGHLWRRRHRRLQRGRAPAGPHRRRGRRGAAPELRAQFLGAPERGAERRPHHAGPGHRRLPAVQHVEAGGELRGRISGPTACPRRPRCS